MKINKKIKISLFSKNIKKAYVIKRGGKLYATI